MKSSARVSGVTLIELLVAMAIGALLMTALVTILIQGGRLLHRLGAITTMRSAATSTLYRLSQEFKRSSWTTVTIVAPNPPSVPYTAVAFRPADPSQTMSFVPCGFFVVYYLPLPTGTATSSAMIRKIWPSNTATTPDPNQIAPDPITNNLHLQPADVVSIASSINGSEQIMLRSVTSWKLLPSTFPMQLSGTVAPSALLSIDIACQEALAFGPDISGAWHTAILPRNP